MTRKKHQSRSVEIHVDATRTDVWDGLMVLVPAWLAVDDELSVQPPWRYCYEGGSAHPALEFFQGTLFLRDDGDSCHVSWGVVFDPEPTAAGLDAIEGACQQVEALLDALAAQWRD